MRHISRATWLILILFRPFGATIGFITRRLGPVLAIAREAQLSAGRTQFFLATIAVGTLGSVAGATGLPTLGDSQKVGGNSFSVGSVDIDVSPASSFIGLDNMAPGSSTTASLVVANEGSVEMRYAMTTESEGSTELATILIARIAVQGGSTCDFPYYANGIPTVLQDDTLLYEGQLALAAFGFGSSGSVDGSRVLRAGRQKVLCFSVSLPLEVGNSLQTLRSGATFSFTGESAGR